MNLKRCVGVSASLIAASALTVSLIIAPTAEATTSHGKRTATFVGDDLHTLTYTKAGLFVTGHQSGSVSKDGGLTWKVVPSFKNVDVMAWATTGNGYLAGGHNGLFRSINNGKSFTRFNFFGKVSDVHALGAAGKYVYMGSPQVGFLRSIDNGKVWKVVNQKFGQGFMGSMLVDPANPLRIIASDMDNGLVISTDGGKRWSRFAGLNGVMSVDWNRKNPKEIVVLGMEAGALTKDNGKTWSTFSVPKGASAIAFSPTGDKISIALLRSAKAEIVSSVNGGKSWI